MFHSKRTAWRANARAAWYRGLEVTSPAAFCYWHRRFPDRHVVGPGTGLLIEGYPGAANSFAREVMKLTQPQLEVASHLHSIAHVTRALRLGIPTVVLLRAPADSVASLLARFPDGGFRPDRELRRYERIYRGVLAVADDVLLVCFEDVVARPGQFIEAVDNRWGLNLQSAGTDAELEQQVFGALDRWSRVVAADRFEVLTPRPSPARAQASARARALVDSCDPSTLDACNRLYRDLADRCGDHMSYSGASRRDTG